MLSKALQFLATLTWQDWVTIAGFFFGLLSLVAYLEQRRSAKETSTLAKWADLNLDKSVSEDQIRHLLAQKATMEEQVARSIPALARAAVLKEQVHLHERALAEHFVARQKAMVELAAAAPASGLDPQLEQAILDRIVPAFQKQEEENRLRTRITVLSVGVAAASTILPFGLGSVLGLLVAPALFAAAIRLYGISEEPPVAFAAIRRWIPWGYAVCVVLVAGFGGLLLLDGYRYRNPDMYIGSVFVLLGAVLSLTYPWARRLLERGLALALGVRRVDGTA